MSGWIKLHRQIKDNWLWSDSVKFKWWIDILLSANHEDGKLLIKGVLVECKRGQCIKSLDSWAKEWRTTKRTVKRFLETLKSDQMIGLESVKVTTRVTVLQYSLYNDSVNGDDAADATQTPPHGKRRGHTNKKKKEGKEEKKYIPSLHEVECYCTENGYPVELAKRVCDYYGANIEDGKWHDQKGDPVLNWKQKIQINWFKPENKNSAQMPLYAPYVPTEKDEY